MNELCRIRNSEAVTAADHGMMTPERFRTTLRASLDSGLNLCCLHVLPQDDATVGLYAALGDHLHGTITLLACRMNRPAVWPSLCAEYAQGHLFEREMHESGLITVEGHPWLKPVRDWSRGTPATLLPAVGDFFTVSGDQVHEVAVGPVHAGIIEPGHFRFQCHGEKVLHLEIALGYQHRGIEKQLPGGPDKRTLFYMETAAGDTTIGHTTAYCHIIEALSGCAVSARSQALRAIALELERMANHTGDLGALAGDVGFQPTMAYCGRLRGNLLNLTAQLCGSRFGRGMIVPGGTGFDVDAQRSARILQQCRETFEDVRNAVELLWDTPSVMARFEGTGALPRTACPALGLVGPAARACGFARDVRVDFADGIYQFAQIPVSTAESGDVFARAFVRWLEIQRSYTFVMEQLRNLPDGSVYTAPGPLRPGMTAVSLVEGWRGEICHWAATDERGRFGGYKIVDPSFHNWTGLAMALRNQQISDFPLCNKSFNLSYCGHDL